LASQDFSLHPPPLPMFMHGGARDSFPLLHLFCVFSVGLSVSAPASSPARGGEPCILFIPNFSICIRYAFLKIRMLSAQDDEFNPTTIYHATCVFNVSLRSEYFWTRVERRRVVLQSLRIGLYAMIISACQLSIVFPYERR
jgi:hypothetical protein